jgi:hypothetical protein
VIEIRIGRKSRVENESVSLASVEIDDDGRVTAWFGGLRPQTLTSRHQLQIDSRFWRRVAEITTAIANARGEPE